MRQVPFSAYHCVYVVVRLVMLFLTISYFLLVYVILYMNKQNLYSATCAQIVFKLRSQGGDCGFDDHLLERSQRYRSRHAEDPSLKHHGVTEHCVFATNIINS